MANYDSAVRTNYFHVKDEAEFRDLMSRAYGTEDSIELWERTDLQGKKEFGFGLYGGIAGVVAASSDAGNEDDYDEDCSYDEFIACLQDCIADDDAIIILEAGHEKLRYVVGAAAIITSKGYETLDITQLATEKAAEILANPGWNTRCEY